MMINNDYNIFNVNRPLHMNFLNNGNQIGVDEQNGTYFNKKASHKWKLYCEYKYIIANTGCIHF